MGICFQVTTFTVLVLCHVTFQEEIVNPSNVNFPKSSEDDPNDSSSEGSTRSNSAQKFVNGVPEELQDHFKVVELGAGKIKVDFQPMESYCMKALRWFEETYKYNISGVKSLTRHNIGSCRPKDHDSTFCGRNAIGHTRSFKTKCHQCAKGFKEVLEGRTRYTSLKPFYCKRAVKECKPLSCPENSTCVYVPSRGGFKCRCDDAGFEGPNCEIEINKCGSSPCQNGATCVDMIDGYKCNCAVGFQGTNREDDTNECDSSPCQNGATCVDRLNRYECNCTAGFEGINCEVDTNECDSSPCQNGATCVDRINRYECNCAAGFEGSNCEDDTNECDSSPCQNGATCVDRLNRYECNCTAGFEGINCEVDTNECDSSPCQNGATCVDRINRYECNCAAGFEGSNCEVDTNECDSSPCQNGAPCVDRLNRYECNCTAGFEGINCEVDTNECDSSPCQNGATCVDRINRYECNCAAGFEGSNCEIENVPVIDAPRKVYCIRPPRDATAHRMRSCNCCLPGLNYRSKGIPDLPRFNCSITCELSSECNCS